MRFRLAYILGYPVLLPLAFYATWLVGRLCLGYWPRPSLDDPKEMGAVMNWVHSVADVVLVVGLPLFVVSALSVVWRGVSRRPVRKLFVGCACASVILMVMSVLFLRWDPHSVMQWHAD